MQIKMKRYCQYTGKVTPICTNLSQAVCLPQSPHFLLPPLLPHEVEMNYKWYKSRVAEREPELEPEPAGAESFGRSRSWSRYTEVSAPAPGSGQSKVVYLIIIHIK
jgi:hypothetical protein